MFDSEKSDLTGLSGVVTIDEVEAKAGYDLATAIQTSNARQPGRSKTSRRNAELTSEYALVALDTIFSSRSDTEIDRRLREAVWNAARFERLPRYDRSYVDGYTEGAIDAVARFSGRKTTRHEASAQLKVPAKIRALQPDAVWHHHPNGGGWVSHTAYVAPTVYVGPAAAVYDRARVTEAAHIRGDSKVCDDADLSGFVKIRGASHIGGDTVLSGRVTVVGLKLFERVYAQGHETLRDEADVARISLRSAAAG